MSDRHLVRLDEVATVNPEQVPKTERAGAFRYLDIAAVYGGDGTVSADRLKNLDWNDAPSRAQRKVRRGDVLISTVRPYLRGGARADDTLDGAVASTGFAVIRADDSAVSPDFLWALVRCESFVRHLASRQSGSNYPAVRPADVQDFAFPLPSASEQRGVVRVIGAADTAVAAAMSHAADADHLARSLRADAMESTDFPLVALEAMAEVTMGRQRSPEHASGDHMLTYLRAANVKDGRLELDDVLSMNFAPDEQAKYALKQGDVLVTEGCGSLDQTGASAKWQNELAEVVCMQNTLLRLRANESITDPEFLYQWARWAFETGEWARVSSGTNIFHIGAKRAAAVEVPMLPLDVQRRLGAQLAAADRTASIAREHLADLRDTRASVLEAMLREDLAAVGTAAPEAVAV